MSKNNFWDTSINEITVKTTNKLQTRVPSVSSASSLHRPRRCRATPAGLSELHCHFSRSPFILTVPRNKQHLWLIHLAKLQSNSTFTPALYTAVQPNPGAFNVWVRLVWVGVNVAPASVRSEVWRSLAWTPSQEAHHLLRCRHLPSHDFSLPLLDSLTLAPFEPRTAVCEKSP